ncbi:MAG TPA: hypothetical protein VK447_14905 [Myxococcaceae bacterium]|nr:hypothetical protein [Myxococcaceae bacterium]
MHRFRFLWLAALLCAGPALAQTAAVEATASCGRLNCTEVSAGLGAIGVGNSVGGVRWGDMYIAPVLEGRLLLGSGFTVEGDSLITLPTQSGGPSTGMYLLARAGYTGERFSITAGPALQLATNASAVQLMPSIRGQYSFGGWGLTAGVMDLHGLAPFHLTVDIGDYGIGYVAPLGAQVHGRFRLNDNFGLRVQAMGFALGYTQVAMVTVAGTYGFPGGAR